MSPSLRRPNDEISDVKAYLGIPQHGTGRRADADGQREADGAAATVHTFGIRRRESYFAGRDRDFVLTDLAIEQVK